MATHPTSGNYRATTMCLSCGHLGFYHVENKCTWVDCPCQLLRVCLTAREFEVGKLLALGNVPKEVATILNIEVNTVEQHKYNLYRKLQIHTQTQLLLSALRSGIITLDEAPATTPKVSVTVEGGDPL